MELKRIFGGTLVSYLNIAVSSLTNLILVPMYIYYLGAEEYGLWLIVLTIVSYLGFSHLGIGQSVANFVAESRATNDHKSIEVGISTAFWLYVLIVTPVICAVVIITGLGFFENLVKVSPELVQAFELLILISSILFLFKLPLTVFGSSLRALNLIYLEQLLSLIFNLLQFFGVLLLLRLGYGLVGLSLIYGSVGIVLGITTFVFLRFNVARLSISPLRFSPAIAISLLKPGGYFFVLQIAGALINGLDNLVIGRYIGAEEVVPFAVAMKLMWLSMSLISVISSNLLPSITAAFAREDYYELQRIYLTLQQVCFGAGLLIFINLAAIGPDFISAWVGIDSYVGDLCFNLILLLFLLTTILWPAEVVIVGTSKHKGYALITVLEGLLNVALSIYWVQIWGVVGAIGATIAVRLATSFLYMIHKSSRITGVSALKMFRRTLSPFILPALGCLVLILFFGQLDIEGIPKIIFHAITLSLAYVWLVFYASLDAGYRAKIFDNVLSFIKA